MMKNFLYPACCCLLCLPACSGRIPVEAQLQDTAIPISPDYNQVIIPWNIAPLHFTIQAEAEDYCTVLYSSHGEKLTARGKQVIFPLKAWKRLLEENKGDTLYAEIYLKKKQWLKYPALKNVIAAEAIDNYLSYRLIEPSYAIYEVMTINQRNLTNFDEQVIYDNTLLSKGDDGQCINCHSYQSYNQSGNLQFHIRQHLGGTVIVNGDEAAKVNLKTEQTLSAGVYPAWHPFLNMIAYSVNVTKQSFHTKNPQKIEVIDDKSGLILYDVAQNEVRVIVYDPGELATFPSWSPDGKYLYYASAAYPENINDSTNISEYYRAFHYNLYRKMFNTETFEFTSTDTVFKASDYGRSATFPRVSPDGRYLLFTLGSYGNFHIWHKNSDLYLLDMQEKTLSAMSELNSSNVESYHSWSSNGRWIVFSSRRDDGSYTRPYIAYFKEGTASKPFILPQKDPLFYGDFFKSYNIPEFMTEPVRISRRKLVHVINREAKQATFNQQGKESFLQPNRDDQQNFYD
jgi:Tol biopolymer transport system component